MQMVRMLESANVIWLALEKCWIWRAEGKNASLNLIFVFNTTGCGQITQNNIDKTMT